MLTIDVGLMDKVNKLMELIQKRNLGYLTISLGFYKTLFSALESSTSSEVPEDEQRKMVSSDGLIRFSVGLDNDIERTHKMVKTCMTSFGYSLIIPLIAQKLMLFVLLQLDK